MFKPSLNSAAKAKLVFALVLVTLSLLSAEAYAQPLGAPESANRLKNCASDTPEPDEGNKQCTPTATETPTFTPTPTSTFTSTPTETPTLTATETSTLTETPTLVPTEPPTLTPTGTPSPTPTKVSAIVFVRPQPPFDPSDTDTNIWIMNPDGSNPVQFTTSTNPERLPALSPDGSKIVYQAFINNQCTSWVVNRDGTNPIQLQVNGSSGNCGGPAWSPNGQQLAFSSDADGFWEIWVINADGSNPRQLSHHPGAAGAPSWSPDGQKLVYLTEPSAKSLDLYTINSDGTGQTLLVSASGTGFSNHQPAWSPDGTQIATIHWSAGRSVGPYDLWLMNADGTNGHVLVSNVDYYDYNNLSWSKDSNWVVFSKNGQVWRIQRDGTGLTQITTTGGWEPDTNADTFSEPAPTATPSRTPTVTPTRTHTQTNTPTSTATPSITPTPTATDILSILTLTPPIALTPPTLTPTPPVTPTPTSTSTSAPTATPPPSERYHVDATTGSNTTGIGSLLAPWKTITYALSQVSGPNTEIHVASGTYNQALGENFPLIMEPGVSLIGAGYDTTTIAGNSSADNPNYHVIYFLSTEAYDSSTVVSRFKITNASQGIRVDGSPTGSVPTLRDNWITGNWKGIENRSLAGRQSYTIIEDNLISGNSYGIHDSAEGRGSTAHSQIINNQIVDNNQIGIRCYSRVDFLEPRSSCSPTIENNLIRGNGESGIVCTTDVTGYCRPLITHNQIIYNQNWGIRQDGCCTGGEGSAAALIINNLIFGNGAGGAFFMDSETPTFINNTIADNHTYGIWSTTDSQARVINSIVWGHTYNLMTGVGNVSYSDIGDGGYAGINNNMSVNPRFVDPANGDYHLLSTSPVLNRGDNTAPNLPDTDIDGDPRILESVVDLGADETTSATPTSTPMPTATFTPPSTPTLTPTHTPSPTATSTPTPTKVNAIVFTRPQPPGDGSVDTDIWIMNPDGSNPTELTTWSGEDRQPAISPNGVKVAYNSRRNNLLQLWVMNSDGTNPAQLPIGANNQSPDWSPDGSQIAFTNDSADWWEIWVSNADGTNPRRLTTHGPPAGEPNWSPDGQKIIYGLSPAAGYKDLYLVNSDGTGQSLFLSASGTGFSNALAAWSPDGTQIATIRWPAGSSGPYNLWLMNADGSNGQSLIQNIDVPHANRISWSADGAWLVFSKAGQAWRVRRDGTGLTQITTTGGWEPDTN